MTDTSHSGGCCRIEKQVTKAPVKIKFAVITVSDRCSAGTTEDKSGPRLCQLCVESKAFDGEIVSTTLIPDEQKQIEATKAVIEREATGLATALIMHSLQHTPLAALSRPVVGIRGRTLIINLPGKVTAVEENFEFLEKILAHAVLHLQDQVHIAHAK